MSDNTQFGRFAEGFLRNVLIGSLLCFVLLTAGNATLFAQIDLPVIDDFNREDELPAMEQWSESLSCSDRRPQDCWFQILDNTLTTTGKPGGGGGTSYFGEVGDADLFVGDITIEFDYEPLTCVGALPDDCLQECPQVPGPVCAGRRWALVFYGAAGTPRPFGIGKGYNLIWSDRSLDRGLSFRLEDNILFPGTFDDIGDPTGTYRVEVIGSRIRIYHNGILYIDYDDSGLASRRREGYVGFWAYNEQLFRMDNFCVYESSSIPRDEEAGCHPIASVNPCYTRSPGGGVRPEVPEGLPITFDASCTQIAEGVNVTAYKWDLGDGSVAEGQVVSHSYAAGVYFPTLTIEHDSGPPVVSSEKRRIEISPPMCIPLSENFDDMAVGEVPVGWTEASEFGGNAGAYFVNDLGQLKLESGQEGPMLFLGDPPIIFSGDLTYEFDLDLTELCQDIINGPGDDTAQACADLLFSPDFPARVLRIFFYHSDTTRDGPVGPYTVAWHDTCGPTLCGLTLDFGDNPGGMGKTGDQIAPPKHWKVEFDGDTVRIYGDGILLLEGNDPPEAAGHRERGGLFGFWAHRDQRFFIDNICVYETGGSCDDVEVCEEPPAFFRRGDDNADGVWDIADPVFNLFYQFGDGDVTPTCLEALDTDNDGALSIVDAVVNLNDQFLGHSGIAAPGPFLCAPDSMLGDEDLGCATAHPICE